MICPFYTMQRWVDVQGKIKQYFSFKKKELRDIFAAVLTLSFIISFTQWGGDFFSFTTGVYNWFNSAIIVLFVIIITNSVQRIVGLYMGYEVEYQAWMTGLIVSLLAIFLSRGTVWVLLPGGIIVHHLSAHRVGHHRYGLDYYKYSLISFSGTLAALFLAIIFRAIGAVSSSALVDSLVFFCVVYAIYDILPLPALTGGKLFFGSRMMYIFGAALVIITGVLLLTDLNILLILFLGLSLAIISWVLYYVGVERFLWKGPYGGGYAPKWSKKK